MAQDTVARDQSSVKTVEDATTRPSSPSKKSLDREPTLTEPSSDPKAGKDLEAALKTDEVEYPKGIKLALIFLGCLLSIFLMALDQTIVATALPVIASKFNAVDRISWVGTAFLLTQAALTLSFGQLLTIGNMKWVYLIVIIVFEVGNVVCGAADSIELVIFGRAIAGVGAAGIFTTCFTIITRVTPLEKRAMLMSSFGGVFAIASVVGPVIGGALTDHVSWRWVFYINLPVGAISIATLILCIPTELCRSVDAGKPLKERLINIDWVGSVLCVGFTTSLLLALQWGGVSRPWDSGSVIACFVVFGVVLPIFLGWQHFRKDGALLPLILFKNRTQIGAALSACLLRLAFFVGVYYLPLYYQASLGHSATKSGIDILSFILLVVTSIMISGIIVRKTGRLRPFLIFGPLFLAMGSGLIFWELTKTSGTSTAHLAGFQVFLGVGTGLAMQNAFLAAQAEYAKEPRLIARSTAFTMFSSFIGGTIGAAVGGTIFYNKLDTELRKYAPDLPVDLAKAVSRSVEIIKTLPDNEKAGVQTAYRNALGWAFILAIVAALCASLAGLLVDDSKLRNATQQMAEAQKEKEKEKEQEKSKSSN